MPKKKTEDKLLEKLVADGKDPPKPPDLEDKRPESGELWRLGHWNPEFLGKTLCPWEPRACEWVGTYRCSKECEFHPENYHMEKEVLETFEKAPWSVYCLTCGEFLDSRYGHPEDHVVATGVMEYRDKIPQFVMERMRRHREAMNPFSI